MSDDIDPLTGLLNRRAQERALDKQVSGGRPGVVVLLDLDHFKVINDRFGHVAGDEVLKATAARLLSSIPREAQVFRVGGDEFVVLVPDCHLDEGRALAERMRAVVSEPLTLGGALRVVTVSAGVGRTPRGASHHALAIADRCVYQAKSSGRSMVVTEEDLDERRAGRYDLVQQFHQMQDQRDALAVLAITDQVTGLRNRRAFDAGLFELHGMSSRRQSPFAVAYIDLDRFHDLNRARGETAGDEALRTCAQALSDVCRDGDVLYRKGGEELVALLPSTDLHGAGLLAERMRLAVIDAAIPYEDRDGSPVVTISGGVAAYVPGMQQSADDVVGAAERGMVTAKDNGRNRVFAVTAFGEAKPVTPD